MVYDDTYNYIKIEQERSNKELILKIHNKFPNLSTAELAQRTGISIEFVESILMSAVPSTAARKKGGRPAGLIKDDAIDRAYRSLMLKQSGCVQGIHINSAQEPNESDTIINEVIGEKKLTFELVAKGLAKGGYSWADLYTAAYDTSPALAPMPDGFHEDLNSLPPDAIQKLLDIADILGPDARFYTSEEEAAELDTPTRRVLFIASRTLRHSKLRKAAPSAKKALTDGHRRTSILARELPAAAEAVGVSLYWVLGSGAAPVSLNSVDAEKLLSAYYFMSPQARHILRACVRQVIVSEDLKWVKM